MKADTGLDKLVGRIQAVRAKTVEQGCTEHEAWRWSDRKRAGPLDGCMPEAAAFFACRMPGEKAPGGTLRYVLSGLLADVAAPRYLYEPIERA